MEQFQATGSRAFYQYALEDVWGNEAATPFWRAVRLVPNETLDQNLQIYRSQEIRDDRMRNATVRGSQRPGGNLPFELSPNGWNPFWWHLLGGSVTTTGPVSGLTTPTAPTGAGSGTGGTLAAGSYTYKVTALNAVGESIASAASTPVVTAGTTGKVTLTWPAVTGATGYKVYGRTGGLFLFMASTPETTWTDTGSATPAGGLAPASDTSGTIYTHVIKGSTSLPAGFSLEKGFVDAGVYIPFLGCRIARVGLNFNIDQIAAGTWEIMSRLCGDPQQASMNTGASPTRPTEKPFTGAQIQVYEGSSLTLLGTARSLSTTIDNNFYGDRGFVLGSTTRNNLKPGDRITELSGTFQFKDQELYQAAVRGDGTAVRVIAGNGVYSVQLDYPNFQFLPNNTTPKATDAGPIEITANGEGLPDSVTGTDVYVTIKTPEASIVI